jgi:electron transfer flavoprotein alpha subunit
MNTIKRIDPRRPFTITADGLRRITLGAIGVAGALDFTAASGAHR